MQRFTQIPHVRVLPPVPLFDSAPLLSHPPAAVRHDFLSPEMSEENRKIQTNLPRVCLIKEQCFKKVRQQNLARVRQELEDAKGPVFLDFSAANTPAGELNAEIFKKLTSTAKANIAYLHLGETTITGILLKGFYRLQELDVRNIFLSTARELKALVDTAPMNTKIWVTEGQKIQLAGV